MGTKSVTITAFLMAEIATNLVLQQEALCWGTDTLVTTNEGASEATNSPKMVSTPSHGYFMVRDNGANECMDIMRSLDGGASWYQYFWYCNGGGRNIYRPTIAVPELKQDYLFVAFASGDHEVLLLRVPFENPNNWSATTVVSSNEIIISGPEIVTDGRQWYDYYLYVAYSELSGPDAWIRSHVVRSLDAGSTWGSPSDMSGAISDMNFVGGKVRASTSNSAYGDGVSIYTSSDYGVTWSVARILEGDGYVSVGRPTLVASHEGRLTVAYERYYFESSNLDIYYSYSLDDGATWVSPRPLVATTADEISPSLAYDPVHDVIHLAYEKDGGVFHSSASFADPEKWSTPAEVNDARGALSPAALVVDWVSGILGMAWQSADSAGPRVRFDRNPAADLIVRSVAINPVSPLAGQDVSVTVTIKNQGTVTTGQFFTDIYRHRLVPPAVRLIGDAYCGATALAAGNTTTCTQTVRYSAAGRFSLWAQVDTDIGVAELNEANNVFGPVNIVVR